VDRDDRPPVATFFAEAALASGETATLSEAAAHHARVKRLDVGDRIRLTDGAGRVGDGSIAAIRRSALAITVERVVTVAPPPPIHLRVPIGDRDRMLWLAEKATELGVATWQGVRFQRSMSVSPRGEGAAFAEKVRARMVSALEQSGGAWLPALLPDVAVDSLAISAGELPILLDAGGDPLSSIASSGLEPVIVFGPEGGLELGELAALTSAGWRPTRLAVSTLRFETAGIAALAVFRAAAC
jgi:16S rRNA (uracil1498-N3)-methyltransferase